MWLVASQITSGSDSYMDVGLVESLRRQKPFVADSYVVVGLVESLRRQKINFLGSYMAVGLLGSLRRQKVKFCSFIFGCRPRRKPVAAQKTSLSNSKFQK